ncbi:MAG: TonB-dependent receptor domain-containing protein [Symbiopectobacterium sp.]
MSTSLFYIAFIDRQISSSNVDLEYEMINAGKVENKGIEAKLSGKLQHNFNYFASYTYTDTKKRDDIVINGSTLPTTGKRSAMPARLITTWVKSAPLVCRWDATF